MSIQYWRVLDQHLQEKTAEQLEGDQRVLVNLLNQVRSEYAHIANELANVISIEDAEALHRYIENSPDIFARLNWLKVFRESAEVISSWSPAGIRSGMSDAVQRRLLQQVGASFRPTMRLNCLDECELVIAVPGQVAGEESVLMLAAPLAEVLPVYAALTGGDLVFYQNEEQAPLIARTMRDKVPKEKLEQFLNRISAAPSAEATLAGHNYVYRRVSLGAFGGRDVGLDAILFRDITQRKALARQQAIQQIFWQLLIIVLSSLVLLLILSTTLSRLRQVTFVLPKLSKSDAYEDTRADLLQASPRRWYADEVDALRDTLVWLSERLEQLHGAEAASEAKSRFLATMSHEIRTPMSGVLGLTELLKRSELPPEAHRMAVMVHESTGNLLGIINDVLDYSRLEAGAGEVEKVDFDPVHLLESVAELVGLTARQKGLRLKLIIDRDCPRQLLGDQGKIRQILLNLVSNAIKFTSVGSVTLSLSVRPIENGLVQVEFVVKDTGIGVPEEAIDKIFQRFAQADSTTTRRFGGSGLGLAICDGLVSLMEGEIGVESQAGQGSSFYVRLALSLLAGPLPSVERPLLGFLVELDLDEDEVACWRPYLLEAGAQFVDAADKGGSNLRVYESDASSGSQLMVERIDAVNSVTECLQRPIRLSGLARLLAGLAVHDKAILQAEEAHLTLFDATILIAEDQTVNRELLQGQLSGLGCRVIACTDGEHALSELAVHENVDLVITDLHMPNLDGYGLVSRLRRSSNPYLKELPVVVLSASSSAADEEQLAARGINQKLKKPLRMIELQACLSGLGLPRRLEGADTLGASETASSDVAVVEAVDRGILNLDLLHEVIGDDLFGLPGLAQLFSETNRPLLQACTQAVQQNDRDELRALTHRLKGSGGSLGAVKLVETLERLEQDLSGGQESVRDILVDLQVDFDAFEQALARLVQTARARKD
ncbi:MAG: ATP-binding protein [Oceanococcus sp.]